MFNILENAVKYTPKGGTIQVTVVPWETYIKIDITDTGRGSPESHPAAIFKPIISVFLVIGVIVSILVITSWALIKHLNKNTIAQRLREME